MCGYGNQQTIVKLVQVTKKKVIANWKLLPESTRKIKMGLKIIIISDINCLKWLFFNPFMHAQSLDWTADEKPFPHRCMCFGDTVAH